VLSSAVRISTRLELQNNFYSIAEEDHKIIQDRTPVLNRHDPLAHDVHSGEVQDFHKSVVGNEGALGLCYLAQLAVEILDALGCR
jgi:hypothetical protein